VAADLPTLALTPRALRDWADHARRSLDECRAELDTLNVFPVADSDTGTNLLLTLTEGAAAVAATPLDASVQTVAAAFTRGTLTGARGNSGVIVGQYVGALLSSLVPGDAGSGSEPSSGGVPVTAAALATALHTAADAAYRAVAQPVEGTVLTVARAVAQACVSASERAPGAPGAGVCLEVAVVEGYGALDRTTAQLPALTAAGVADAGAWGLLLVLDALCAALGRDVGVRPHPVGRPVQPDGASPGCTGGGEYEVMYVVTPGAAGASGDPADGLRGALSRVGGSVAVIGGRDMWQVHVHTDGPGAALAVAQELGAVRTQVRVRHLAAHREAQEHAGVGLVVVTRAPGLVGELARAGAVVVLVDAEDEPGPELERAVADTGAALVVVLSVSGPSARPPRAPAAAPGSSVVVLDALTEAQVVSGAVTYSTQTGERGPDALVAGLSSAVRAVRGAVVGPPAGDLAVGDVTDRGHAELVRSTSSRLLAAGGSLLTLITSTGTPTGLGRAVADAVGAAHPDVEVLLLHGEGAGAAVTIGVE
jgi:dihydroxyacetone kinase-like predicted kinase